MDTPTIFDVLDRLSFLHGMPSVVVLLLVAFVAIAAWDIRLAIPALLVHYLLAGLLFVDVLDPRLAVVYALAGLFVSAILLVTAWQMNWGRPPVGLTAEEAAEMGVSPHRSFGRLPLSDRALLRLFLSAVMLVIALWTAQQPSIRLTIVPEELAYLTPAIIGLVGLGLVGMTTSPEPLAAGIGLLLFLTGFSLYYGFLDQSLIMTIALIVAQLTTALVVAYLSQARYLPADVLD